jgi:hypothetical protein
MGYEIRDDQTIKLAEELEQAVAIIEEWNVNHVRAIVDATAQDVERVCNAIASVPKPAWEEVLSELQNVADEEQKRLDGLRKYADSIQKAIAAASDSEAYWCRLSITAEEASEP